MSEQFRTDAEKKATPRAQVGTNRLSKPCWTAALALLIAVLSSAPPRAQDVAPELTVSCDSAPADEELGAMTMSELVDQFCRNAAEPACNNSQAKVLHRLDENHGLGAPICGRSSVGLDDSGQPNLLLWKSYDSNAVNSRETNADP